MRRKILAKRAVSVLLGVPATILAVWVNPAIWYLSLAGLIALTVIGAWNMEEAK